MKNRVLSSMITACLDANVLISGIAFGGKPLEVIQRALNRKFHMVTGQNILQEVEKNLLGKIQLKKSRVDKFISDIAEVSSVFVPNSKIRFIDQ